MSKNIVICLDGTGNQLKARGNTNVVCAYELLDLADPSRQIAFYDPGVGTFSAQGTWTPAGRRLTRLLGLAVGYGLRTNLGEAYTYLMRNYRPGDQIFILGFSRGAFAARALAGMLHTIGLMRPGSENLVPYAISTYCRSKRWTDTDRAQAHRFARTFSIRIDGHATAPVRYLGVWDSVKAAGVLRWNLRWLFTRTIPNARAIRHAVSIDEKRRPYREYLFTHPARDGRTPAAPPAWGEQEQRGPEQQGQVQQGQVQDVQEMWFAGVHSDVGGTFEDDPRLACVALKWIVDGALAEGLLLTAGTYERKCAVTAEHALGKVHRMGWIWVLLTYRRRRVPADAVLHQSVQMRRRAMPGYGRHLPDTVAWGDLGWLEPSEHLRLPAA